MNQSLAGELADSYWKEMKDTGSQVVEIDLKASFRLIDQSLLNNIDPKHFAEADICLMIQKELTEMRRFIPETEAGKTPDTLSSRRSKRNETRQRSSKRRWTGQTIPKFFRNFKNFKRGKGCFKASCERPSIRGRRSLPE